MSTLRVWDAKGGAAEMTVQVEVMPDGTYMLPDSVRDLPVGHYWAQVDHLPGVDVEVRAAAPAPLEGD